MSDLDLCDLCRSIPFHDLPHAPPSKGSSRLGGVTQNPILWLEEGYKSDAAVIGFPYHRNIEALAESARSCTLCQLISEQVVAWTERYDEAYRNNGGGIWTSAEDGFMKFPSGQQLWLTRRLNGSDGFVMLVKDPGFWGEEGIDGERASYLLAGVGFCVEPESPLASRFLSRPIHRDSASPASLNVAQAWLDKCVNSHERCSSQKAVMPTRVLDVGAIGDSSIKLVITEGTQGSWFSLSHCWGGALPLVTTTKNVASHLQGIPFDRLPQTFKDAVVITRHMGFSYLWIDSLCICQDDAADWAREAAKMAEVYSNAHLVIAADHAPRGSVGCFSIRSDRHRLKTRIPLRSDGSEVVEAIPLRPDKEARSPWDSNWDSEPLSHRAWVLQERALALRTLHYCTDQMYFECNYGILGEDGFKSDDRFCNALAQMKHGPDQKDVSPSSARQTHWNDVLTQYGRRRLTHRTDRFPALSGLAKSFSERGVEYVVGLWSDALVEGLSWRSFPNEHSRSIDDIEGPESPYIAPSWSWASFEGAASTAVDNRWKNVAVVEEYHYDLKTSNPFGEVTAGWLRITGPMISATISVKTEWQHDEQYLGYDRYKMQTSESGEEGFLVHTDHPKQFALKVSQMADITLLVLGIFLKKRPDSGEDQEKKHRTGLRGGTFCLVLTPSKKHIGKMKRIGWCVPNSRSLASDLEQHTGTVVLV